MGEGKRQGHPDVESAEAFVRGVGWPESRVYEFPFVCVDEPGPESLGRIEWWLELQRGKRQRGGRWMIERLLIWARQTRDERYRGRCFEIPCCAESLSGHGPAFGGLVRYIWLAAFCCEHRALAFGAYPSFQASKLVVDVRSSISLLIYFC